MATLVGGSLAAQGIALATAPFLTRLYTPADFGLAALYASLLGAAGTVAAGRYEWAIPLPESDEEALSLLAVCGLLVGGSAVLCGAAVWVGATPLLTALHAGGLRPYAWLLPVSILATGFYQALNYWAVRRRMYGRIAQTRLMQSMSAAAAGIGTGVLSHGPLGLLLATVASQAAGTSSLARDAFQTARGAPRPSLARILRAAAVYRQFPMYSAGAALLNNMSGLLPPVLLLAFYTPQVAGWFGLAQRVLSVPMALVGTSVSQVFLGEAAESAREAPRQLRQLFSAATRKLSVLGLAILAAGAASLFLFPVLFGGRWREAGLYALLMAVHCALQVTVSPVSMVAVLMKRQDLQLALDAARALAVALSLWVPHRLHAPAVLAVGAYCGVMALVYAISWGVYARLASQASKEVAPGPDASPRREPESDAESHPGSSVEGCD